jgi:hypothetical protein
MHVNKQDEAATPSQVREFMQQYDGRGVQYMTLLDFHVSGLLPSVPGGRFFLTLEEAACEDGPMCESCSGQFPDPPNPECYCQSTDAYDSLLSDYGLSKEVADAVLYALQVARSEDQARHAKEYSEAYVMPSGTFVSPVPPPPPQPGPPVPPVNPADGAK